MSQKQKAGVFVIAVGVLAVGVERGLIISELRVAITLPSASIIF